jgi:COP9 signalosome complex subunit 7
VNITSVASLRDLPPASIPSLIQALRRWSSQCSNTLASLEQQVERVKERAKAEGERKNTVKKIIDEKITKEEEKKEKKYASGKDVGDDGYDPMEVDTGGSGRQTRSSKKGFWASAVGR